MPKIERVELYHFAAPLPAVFRPSWIPGYPQRENRATLIRVVTDDGVEGWAAGAAFSREREGLGNLLGPYLLGLDPFDLATIQQRLRELSYLGWRNGWIEPAIWDIVGKYRNQPVYALFGGEVGGRVPLYASTGEVKDPQERVEEVERLWDQGFRAVKLRVHAPTLAEDLAQVEAVAKAFQGRDLTIGVDANQGWLVDVAAPAPRWDYDRALAFCEACAELGVAWVEEPLPMDAYRRIARLRRATRVTLAGGELHTGGWPELRTMIELGCYDMYQPDCTFVGGIAAAIRIMHRCNAERLRFTPHTWTNGLGFAANLQVVGANPRRAEEWLEYPLAPPGWVPEARDAMLAEPWLPVDGGWLELPTRPGLGVEIDRRAIRRWGECFYRATPVRVAIQVLADKGLATTLELNRWRRLREEARSQGD